MASVPFLNETFRKYVPGAKLLRGADEGNATTI
jgi:hypothetical protein